VETLLRHNLALCTDYLLVFPGDYRFLIQFRDSENGFRIDKRGNRIVLDAVRGAIRDKSAFDVIYTVRLPYLKWSLTTQYGHEILFVGSGGVFEYLDAGKAKQNLHRELIVLLRRHNTAPSRRRIPPSGAVFQLKRTAKKILGKQPLDLYDLGHWTEFGSDSAPRR
jgi:hypothetical protein